MGGKELSVAFFQIFALFSFSISGPGRLFLPRSRSTRKCLSVFLLRLAFLAPRWSLHFGSWQLFCFHSPLITEVVQVSWLSNSHKPWESAFSLPFPLLCPTKRGEKNISLNRDDERINIAFLENANGELFCILKQKGLKIWIKTFDYLKGLSGRQWQVESRSALT